MDEVRTDFNIACRYLSAKGVLATWWDSFQFNIEEQRSNARRCVQADIELHRPTWERGAEMCDNEFLERSTAMKKLIATTRFENAWLPTAHPR